MNKSMETLVHNQNNLIFVTHAVADRMFPADLIEDTPANRSLWRDTVFNLMTMTGQFFFDIDWQNLYRHACKSMSDKLVYLHLSRSQEVM